jgi:hypothetical protein
MSVGDHPAQIDEKPVPELETSSAKALPAPIPIATAMKTAEITILCLSIKV